MTTVEVRPPPVETVKAMTWMRANLFPNARSAIVTIVLAPLIAYLAYRAFTFVFINGRWEVIERNLTLFMQGTFPRDQQWRIVAQLLLFALAFGVGGGTAAAAARDKAREAGLALKRSRFRDLPRRYWSVIMFVAALLLLASTATPYLLVAAAVGLAWLGSQASRLPTALRTVGWLLMALGLVAGFQVVSGTTGRSWLITAAVVVPAVWSLLPSDRLPHSPIGWGARAAAVALTVGVVFVFYSVVTLPGLGWDNWSGLHLTLWASALAIILSFPLGLLLALARRSTLPALRFLATGYIELIRGVPLITLLFMGRFILGFLLPAGTDLSNLTRAIAAMTLFTAAYVAEIVRGGLQSLPKGQTEAGQALGLGPPTVMRRIILPQALRAVIPAMVGQFISIFKDSSLLVIIAINEFLGVRSLVHAQADFRGIAHAETLVFVAFGYWAFSYAMSKESQRLEVRLRVRDR